MKINIILIALIAFALQSCNFETSVNKDVNLMTGLSTSGVGISCDDVYLSIEDNIIQKKTFVYGEKFYINFNNISGLKNEAGSVFPGMKLLIISQDGDTVMNEADLYADFAEGFSVSPLMLRANIVVANPIHSNKSYTLHINIWDKKGKGKYNAKLKFNVVENENIKIENDNVSFNEVYLFSQERGLTITDNKINLDETNYLIFEGLEGMTEVEGNVSIGVSIKITDAEDREILNEDDLVGEYLMTVIELKEQLTPSFVISNQGIKTPIKCEVQIWDKRSENKIKASLDLDFK